MILRYRERNDRMLIYGSFINVNIIFIVKEIEVEIYNLY